MERIYPLLYQYLLSNKILLLPKIGTFSLSNVGARYDYPTQSLQAPYMDFTFQANVNSKKKDAQLYSFLSHALNDSSENSEQQLDDFSESLLNNLNENGTVQLPGIGFLRYINNTIVLDTTYTPKAYYPDQPILPVKRDNAQTIIRAGDREYTNREMEDLLEQKKNNKKGWLYFLITLLVLGLAAGLYYYMMRMQNKI